MRTAAYARYSSDQQRDASLEEFVDDATRIDAAIGRQLLVSLFVMAKDNELHDGAVVIGKNARIELARALLPLSRATDLGSEFGTRHRAALGIKPINFGRVCRQSCGPLTQIIGVVERQCNRIVRTDR